MEKTKNIHDIRLHLKELYTANVDIRDYRKECTCWWERKTHQEYFRIMYVKDLCKFFI